MEIKDILIIIINIIIILELRCNIINNNLELLPLLIAIIPVSHSVPFSRNDKEEVRYLVITE